MFAALGLIVALLLACFGAEAAHASPSRTPRMSTVKIGVVDYFKPYSFMGTDGRMEGAIPDLWRLWAKKTGVMVEFIPLDGTHSVELLQNKSIDIIGSIPKNTALTDAGWTFAAPLLDVSLHAFYHPDISDITTPENLKPFTVGAVKQGACPEWLNRQGIIHQRLYPSYGAMILGVSKGEVNVFCSAEGNAVSAFDEYGVTASFQMSPPLFTTGIHWLVSPDRPDLSALVSQGLAAIPAKSRAAITAHWITYTPRLHPKNALLIQVMIGLFAVFILVLAWGLGFTLITMRRNRQPQNLERRFAALLRNIPDFAWAKDRDGKYLFANVSFSKACGTTMQAVEGKTDRDLFPPQQAESYRNDDIRVMNAGETEKIIERMTHADGTEIWVETIKIPWLNEQGMALGTFGIARDISAFKQNESNLKQAVNALIASEGRYRDLLSVGQVSVIEFNPAGEPVFVSENVLRRTGLPQQAMLAMGWTDLIHPADHTRIIQALVGLLSEGKAFQMEFRLRDYMGAEAWFLGCGVPHDETGGAILVLLDIGDKKRAEERLKINDAAFQELTENSPNVIALYDPHGRHFYANPQIFRIFGCPALEVRGKTPTEISSLPAAASYESDIRTTALIGVAQEFEYAWIGTDGEPIVCQFKLLPQRNDSGKVCSVLCVGHDITRIKTAEQNLSMALAQMKNLIDNLPGVAYRKHCHSDGSATISYVSDGFWDMIGRSSSDILKMSLEERLAQIWHPDDRDALMEFVQSAWAGHPRHQGKVRLLHADGSVLWVLIREKVVSRTDTQIVTEGMIIDISEEMSAREALQAQAEKLKNKAQTLQTLLNNLHGCVFRMEYKPNGEKHIIEMFAPPITEFYGDIGSHHAAKKLIHPDDVDFLYKDVRNRLMENGCSEHDFRAIHQDGTLVWLHAKEKVVERHDDGTLIVEGQVFDITTQVKAQQLLTESERQRTQAEERLRETRRLEALGQLAGGIAHDFNNLLGAISGFSQFIGADAAPNSSISKHNNRILSIVAKGRNIIDQILNLSQHKETKKISISPSAITTEIESIIAANKINKPKIETLIDSGIYIFADYEQIMRLLINLCMNALDALPPQNGQVGLRIGKGAHVPPLTFQRLIDRHGGKDNADVEVWEDEHGNSWGVSGAVAPNMACVTLSVEDNGSGMDAERIKRIFDPFFTTKERTQGTGLGLSVVHGIVLAHDAALAVRSRPHSGTRFDILLPLAEHSTAQHPQSFSATFIPKVRKKVLLVDDNEDVCDAMAEILTRMDFVPSPFTNPVSAFELFQQSPDVWGALVTDQLMPNLLGTELIRKTKEIRPDLGCILCTGYADALTEEECLEIGASIILKKPIEIGDLIKSLDDFYT